MSVWRYSSLGEHDAPGRRPVGVDLRQARRVSVLAGLMLVSHEPIVSMSKMQALFRHRSAAWIDDPIEALAYLQQRSMLELALPTVWINEHLPGHGADWLVREIREDRHLCGLSLMVFGRL